MYRLIFCFIVFQTVYGHRSWCNHKHHDYRRIHDKENDFHELSWDVVRLDRKSQRICETNTNYTKETFFANSYKLTVALPEFEEENIIVKLRHRVLFIEAYKPSSRKLFTELKILPEFVKGVDAAWTFVDGELNINIPYKFTLGKEVVRKCDEQFDESLVTIPKMDIDVRFGDESTPTAAPPISENVV